MKMKSFRRNKKGVSDVIAVLLMIAIAVAASLIAYAWVMGYLGGTTTKVGKAILIQSMYYDGTNLNVYVQNVGDSQVTLSSIYVNGMLQPSPSFITSADLPKNQTRTASTPMATAFPNGFNPTNAVDVKVVCSDGTFIEAIQTVPGP
jgi:flagellin-like protein